MKHSIGDAILGITFFGGWATGLAAATEVGTSATFFSPFPPVAWVYAAKWFMGII